MLLLLRSGLHAQNPPSDRKVLLTIACELGRRGVREPPRAFDTEHCGRRLTPLYSNSLPRSNRNFESLAKIPLMFSGIMEPMRRITFVAMLLAAACGGPAPQSQQQTAITPEQAEQDIRQAEKDWAAAVMASDFAKLNDIYDDRLIYAHSTGIVQTKSEYLEKLKTGSQRYDAIDHESLEIRPFGDAVIAHSRVRMQGQNPDGPFNNRLMMIHVWIHEDGRWRIAAHQTTQLEAIQ